MHLDRMITILEAVAVAGRPITASDVQGATDLPRPTCYRLLQTLTEQRLLSEDDGRYQVGERLVRIALLGQTDHDVRHAAAPIMQEAAIGLGEAVFLSRFRDRKVEIIHVETPSDPARSFIHPGLGSRPMHACSCSKAIAAFAEGGFREEILAGPLRAYTRFTKHSPDDVREEFSVIRQNGYAECVEEIELGVSSVAAPVRIGNVGATFSIGATGPVRRFTEVERRRIGGDLIGLSNKIARALELHQTGALPVLSDA